MDIFSRQESRKGRWRVSYATNVWGQRAPRWTWCGLGSPVPIPGYGRVCERRVARQTAALNPCRDRSNAPARVRIQMRPYQEEVFMDRESGTVVLHWARQIGKSFTLAAWAVDRLLTRPGRLVTVLSNSRDNGAEFVAKCAEVCQLNGTDYTSVDKSQGVQFKNMRMEVRIRHQGQTGRIKVLAANPRTARGFSGDLILDEFAFHEDSAAIWEAAEPILSANKDYLCRIASTGNGKHNLFYRFVSGIRQPVAAVYDRRNADEERRRSQTAATTRTMRNEAGSQSRVTSALRSDATEDGSAATGKEGIKITSKSKNEETPSFCSTSQQGFKVSRITRTQAHKLGVMIYDPNTREPIEPAVARAQAVDKLAYDQNYECAFANENLTLLTHELIDAAEREDVGFICEQDWSNVVMRPSGSRASNVEGRESAEAEERAPWSVLDFLRNCSGPLYAGLDVARSGDLSVLTVLEDLNGLRVVRAILRMRNLRLPEQQQRLAEVCRLRRFHRAAIDMTGLGLGLFEYAQAQHGGARIHGINFGGTVPATDALKVEGRRRETVRVTEAMAMELLQAYEDRRIQHPADAQLREDLRKPERITTPGGRVSIAAARDAAGHADHFWSLALALEAAGNGRHTGGWKGSEEGGVRLIKPERRGFGL